jgi:hypothetical protein
MIKHIKSKIIQIYRGQWYLDILMDIYDIPSFIKWRLDKSGRNNLKKLKSLKNKYKGKRCFILGNGPSLAKTDLKPLKKEYTFGLNRIFLLFKKMGFEPTFLVSVNRLVIEQSAKEINKTKSLKFIEWQSKEDIKGNSTVYLRTRAKQMFSKNITHGVWEGATVTYVALQIAYYLGFTEVILLGVDHSFKTKGLPHQEIVSDGNDPNHFDSKYFKKGFRWNLPDLSTSEYAYKLAKKAYEAKGRKILDATINGKLKVFSKVSYKSLLEGESK